MFLAEEIPKDQRGKITKLWVAPQFREQRETEREEGGHLGE